MGQKMLLLKEKPYLPTIFISSGVKSMPLPNEKPCEIGFESFFSVVSFINCLSSILILVLLDKGIRISIS